jgi:hypothetical protein
MYPHVNTSITMQTGKRGKKALPSGGGRLRTTCRICLVPPPLLNYAYVKGSDKSDAVAGFSVSGDLA